jgi:hypothetical protein
MKNHLISKGGFARFSAKVFVLLLLSLLSTTAFSQNRELNLRLSSVLGQNESLIELKGPPVLFLGSGSSNTFNNKEFVAGLGYIYPAKPGSDSNRTFRRFIVQLRPKFENETREWNLADGDRVTLDFTSKSYQLTAGFGLGKVIDVKSFRFRIGAETGLSILPAYDETQRYEFFDTVGAYIGAQTVITENLNQYGGYLNLMGSVHYLIGNHLSLGVELGYGLRASYISGEERTIYQTYDSIGTPVLRADEVGTLRNLSLSLPQRIDLPYLSFGYRF